MRLSGIIFAVCLIAALITFWPIYSKEIMIMAFVTVLLFVLTKPKKKTITKGLDKVLGGF